MFNKTFEDFHMQYHNDSESFQNVDPYSFFFYNLVMTTIFNLTSTLVNEIMSQHRIVEITQYYNGRETPISFVHENGSVSVIGNQIERIAAVSDDFEVQFEGASTGYTVIFTLEMIVGFAPSL